MAEKQYIEAQKVPAGKAVDILPIICFYSKVKQYRPICPD